MTKLPAELAFWAAVAFVAVAAVIFAKLAAASPLGDRLPALRQLIGTI